MSTPTNVLLIMTDEQRYDTIAALGNPHIKTPNLDRLVREGVACENHYTSFPICTPARATIITGRQMRSHGAWHVGYKLDPAIPNLPTHLAAHGYHTGIIGKAHYEAELTGHPQAVPDDQPYYGFKTHLLCEDNIEGPYTDFLDREAPEWREELQYTANEELWPDQDAWESQPGNNPGVRGVRVNDAPEHLHHTHWIADRSIDFFNDRSDDDAPFFLKTSFVQPHHPYAPPRRYFDMYPLEELPEFVEMPELWPEPISAYNRVEDMTPDQQKLILATYWAMVTFIDDQIGRMLDALQANGQLDNTLILFTSDHGDYAGHRGLLRKGGHMYEELIKVPMLYRLPHARHAARRGSRVTGYTQHEDLAATICDLIGVAPHDDFLIDGHSQAATLAGDADSPRDYAFIEMIWRPKHVCGIVSGGWKLISLTSGDWWLVDLKNDPHETTNRAGDPAVADIETDLRHKLLDHLTQTDFWLPKKDANW